LLHCDHSSLNGDPCHTPSVQWQNILFWWCCSGKDKDTRMPPRGNNLRFIGTIKRLAGIFAIT
jgi:hypothetical protein